MCRLFAPTRAGKRARKHHVPRFECHVERRQLVGQPSDCHCRVAEHACRQAGLLDFPISMKQDPHPPKINILRPHRTPAEHQTRRRPVIGDRIENLSRILHARIDDFDGWHDVVGSAQHIDQADVGPLQRLLQYESQFRFHPRYAEIRVPHLGPILYQHIVEQMPVIRLVDLRRRLHCLGGQSDLVADEPRAARDFELGHGGGDRVGIGDLDGRKSGR